MENMREVQAVESSQITVNDDRVKLTTLSRETVDSVGDDSVGDNSVGDDSVDDDSVERTATETAITRTVIDPTVRSRWLHR